MKVKFISNACCIVETNAGTQILTDPWIENGVFEGSWCHFHTVDFTSLSCTFISQHFKVILEHIDDFVGLESFFNSKCNFINEFVKLFVHLIVILEATQL